MNMEISGLGKISSGEYDNLSISGCGRLDGEIRCNSFSASGLAKGIALNVTETSAFREVVNLTQLKQIK